MTGMPKQHVVRLAFGLATFSSGAGQAVYLVLSSALAGGEP